MGSRWHKIATVGKWHQHLERHRATDQFFLISPFQVPNSWKLVSLRMYDLQKNHSLCALRDTKRDTLRIYVAQNETTSVVLHMSGSRCQGCPTDQTIGRTSWLSYRSSALLLQRSALRFESTLDCECFRAFRWKMCWWELVLYVPVASQLASYIVSELYAPILSNGRVILTWWSSGISWYWNRREYLGLPRRTAPPTCSSERWAACPDMESVTDML